VSILAPKITDYDITATLTLAPGLGQLQALDAAQAAVEAFADSQFRMGGSVARALLSSALVVEGVENVALTLPSGDISAKGLDAPRAASISLATTGGGI